MNVYDFTVKTRDGQEKSLRDYEGKVLLIVNTATGCGFTPQYEDLEALYEELGNDNFEILDFPCNQFGEQAPGTDEEIHQFCTLKYDTKFPRFSKIDVNGENADPLFKYLTENTTFGGFHGIKGKAMEKVLKKMNPYFEEENSVKWNFTKFLVDKNGDVKQRFEPTQDMKKVAEEVRAAL